MPKFLLQIVSLLIVVLQDWDTYHDQRLQVTLQASGKCDVMAMCLQCVYIHVAELQEQDIASRRSWRILSTRRLHLYLYYRYYKLVSDVNYTALEQFRKTSCPPNSTKGLVRLGQKGEGHRWKMCLRQYIKVVTTPCTSRTCRSRKSPSCLMLIILFLFSA